MNPNIIVLDLETKNAFSEVEGGKAQNLGISVIGTYLYREDKYKIFHEDQIGELEELLTTKPLLVGFNIKKFDLAVLKPYLKMNPNNLPVLDIMEEFVKVLGHRVSLDSVATATLGAGKTGHGLDAIKYFRNSEWEKLEKYCLQDVKITKEVFEYGANNGELFYLSKFSKVKSRAPVNWKVENPEEAMSAQYSLL
jgi:DEAD/DEAH box helicase domain-containing protein